MTEERPRRSGGEFARRLALRFVCVYFVVYSAPMPLNQLPGSETVFAWYDTAWKASVVWFARTALGMPISEVPAFSGSGDTTCDYVGVLMVGVLALVGSVAWTLLDRKSDDRRIADVLRGYVRVVLGATMIVYGTMKIIKSQFPFPSGDELMETYGESSPMHLAWTFMGYSTAYNVFTGLVEFVGGFLLFFRRTSLLGALVLAGALANVVMINFCYDVPVKLYSSHLFLMALWLIGPDARRLADVLVFGRPAAAPAPRVPLAWRWVERARPWAAAVVLASTVYGATAMSLKYGPWSDNLGAKGPLYGIHVVESFQCAAAGAVEPWTRWCVGHGNWLVRRGAGDPQYLEMRVDEGARTLTLASPGSSAPGDEVWHYAWDDDSHLALDGEIAGAATHVRFRRVDESKLLLVNRGFHWINETPYNR